MFLSCLFCRSARGGVGGGRGRVRWLTYCGVRSGGGASGGP